MSNKLLVIVGPTASGKTELAAKLAKKFNGELVSADSRQVYKYMDIGTGKDRPKGVKIWGYDLVEPTEEFSVAQYETTAKKIIADIQKKGKLPILVGGTGLYVKAIVDGIETSSVKKNKALRSKLGNKPAEELFSLLKWLDSKKTEAMNMPDRKNPRRLIRAIEIAISRDKLHKGDNQRDSLMIGLRMSREDLNKRIEKRVEKRIEMGFEGEVEKLLKMGVSWEDQSMQALGYRQWKEKNIDEWKRQEKKYAKRQMTWFKKNKHIKWFDASRKDTYKKVEAMVKKWYSVR